MGSRITDNQISYFLVPRASRFFSRVVGEVAAISAFIPSLHSLDPCAHWDRFKNMLHVNVCSILITDLHKLKLITKSTIGCMKHVYCEIWSYLQIYGFLPLLVISHKSYFLNLPGILQCRGKGFKRGGDLVDLLQYNLMRHWIIHFYITKRLLLFPIMPINHRTQCTRPTSNIWYQLLEEINRYLEVQTNRQDAFQGSHYRSVIMGITIAREDRSQVVKYFSNASSAG